MKSVLITHSCGHAEWHRYNEYKYRDKTKYRAYCSWLSEQECNSCQAKQLNKEGSEKYLVELTGSPSAIVYGAKCRQNLLDAIYNLVYQGYEDYLNDPEFQKSEVGLALRQSYRKYKHVIGDISSASTFIKLSQQDLSDVLAFLHSKMDEE